MATVLTNRYRTFARDGVWSDPLFDYEHSITYHFDNNASEFLTISDAVVDIVDNGNLDIPPLPSSGHLEQDELYQWSGMVVRVRQSHERTIYDPTQTPALFSIYRKEIADMDWIDGEKVDIGTIRLYEAVKYECIQAHQTQSDWTPTDTIGVLWKVWEDVPVGDEYPVYKPVTGAHDVYMKDDIVWYPELNDTLYISTIDNNSWAPEVYGWIEYAE